MTSTQPSAQDLRNALMQILPSETSTYGNPPDARHVYLPSAHSKALRRETTLVVGDRGVGKTYLSSALNSEKARKMMGGDVPFLSQTEVSIGFSEKTQPSLYPDTDTLIALIRTRRPYSIWKAVVYRWAMQILGEECDEQWEQTVEHTEGNPESFSKCLERANQVLEDDKVHGLLVFDALDRTASDWATMDEIVKDLLRLSLFLKPFSNISTKVFLRTDQFKRKITDFPDASKLLATKVELNWTLTDLYALLWHLLLNSEHEAHNPVSAHICEEVLGKKAFTESEGVNILTSEMRQSEEIQTELFHRLAGQWMGKNRRRGNTYTWIVSHLADGHRQTSPRSFIAAIKRAAERTADSRPEHTFALHYDDIKQGVQHASGIRVGELAEDYPWVTELMEPLKESQIVVPCDYQKFVDGWRETFGEELSEGAFGASDKLKPENIEKGWDGLRTDLEQLGIMETMRDGRVNMPDLFRVGFGFGRKGGVRPVSRQS